MNLQFLIVLSSIEIVHVSTASIDSDKSIQKADGNSSSWEPKVSTWEPKVFEEITPETTTEFDLSRFSEKFLNCSHTPVEYGFYDKYQNQTVYVELYRKYFEPTDYFIAEDNYLYICPDFFNGTESLNETEKFSDAMGIVTLIGVSISTPCIILHVVMFTLIRKLRNLPGYCLLSLCTALLIAYACIFAHSFLPDDSDCSSMGMVMLYFFLASFFWMNVMSYDVWRSLRMATAQLRLTADKPMLLRFALYSLYSWGVPLLIVIVALVTDATATSPNYKLIFRVSTCWLKYREALLVYFALPLFSLIFINLLFYVSSFYMIHQATMNTSEKKADIWSQFLISMRLAVAMGLMWIFGVLAVTTQFVVLWYFYAICNALQGVFIFFSFTLTEKTRRECKTLLRKKKSSNLPTQTTSQQQTSF